MTRRKNSFLLRFGAEIIRLGHLGCETTRFEQIGTENTSLKRLYAENTRCTAQGSHFNFQRFLYSKLILIVENNFDLLV